MGMRNEYFLYLAHLDGALLNLVLSRLTAIKEPYVSIQTQSKGGMVPGGRGLRGCAPENCYVY